MLRAKNRGAYLAELADNLSANCPQKTSVVEVQLLRDAEISFGEPFGRTGDDAGIG